MKVIPEAAQRTIALETGEIDLAYDIIANDLDKVKDNPDLQLFEAPSLSCYYITMNMNKKPFDDERVREAINLAIDRQLLVDTIINGAGEPADAIIAPDVFGYSSPGAYEYDPEKAKELLAEAGYEDGFSTSIWVNDNQERKEACEAIQAMLAEIGIDCQIEVMEFGSFIEKLHQENMIWHTLDGQHLLWMQTIPIIHWNTLLSRALPATVLFLMIRKSIN